MDGGDGVGLLVQPGHQSLRRPDRQGLDDDVLRSADVDALRRHDDGRVLGFRRRRGWYVRYPSGSGVGASAPAWLSDYDGSLNLLFGGSAYVGTRRDAVSCTRTAEIVGPAGQLCATLPLEGSGGCDASDETSPDGTLVLHASDSCSLRWWPKLGRGH
jgi:hypothetical protein